MGEDLIPFFGDVKDTMQGIIKVVGVGGGGCNAVRNMYKEGVEGVTFAACNTDSQSLKGSPVPVKLLMGEGLGAGGDPEIGKSEAEKSLDSLNWYWLCSSRGSGCKGTEVADGRCGDDSFLFREEAEDRQGPEGCG